MEFPNTSLFISSHTEADSLPIALYGEKQSMNCTYSENPSRTEKLRG